MVPQPTTPPRASGKGNRSMKICKEKFTLPKEQKAKKKSGKNKSEKEEQHYRCTFH
jgi:hypothetical protein